MKSTKRISILAVALLGAISVSGCVYYPSRPYYRDAHYGHTYYREYYPDGYTPYYTSYYARPYTTAVWVEGGYHHGHWVDGHWR